MIDAGRIVPLPKGTYDDETQYEILDFVFYPVDGNTYVATQTTIGNAPSQESAYWQLLAQGSVVDIALDSESGRPVANSVITNALLNKLNVDGALDNNVVNTFNSIQDTLPVPTVGDTQSTLWGKVIKWFADARNRFLSSTGDVSSTTVAQFTDYESENWPQPEAGETMSSLMGKIASFFNTSRWFFTQHGLTKNSLKNNGTTTETGVYALDAKYGKTLTDQVASLNSRIDAKSWYRLLASGISISTTKTTLGTFGNRAFSDYSFICVMAYDSGMVRSTQIIPTFIFKERTVSLTWVNSINQQYWVEIGYATETTFTAQTSTSANGTTVFLYAIQL